MSLLRPADRGVLATAVVDSLVVASDPAARGASAYYWDRGRLWTEAVVRAVTSSQDPVIRGLGQNLVADPGDPAGYFALRSALTDAGPSDPSLAAIYDVAWRAECNSRLGYLLGPDYARDEPYVPAAELEGLPPGEPLDRAGPGGAAPGGAGPGGAAPGGAGPGGAGPGGAGPGGRGQRGGAEVLIVIPFQDRGAGRARLRNLLACLLSLRDQSFPRERYQVTVVESDEVARWGEVIKPRADHYLFAPKPGAFNKSWSVNAGVIHTPGEHEVICILDADVLVDREFVERNAARFRRPGTGGHLTYRNMLSLDPPATSHAIRDRLERGAAQPGPDHFRGFVLRRPPGCCIWVRSAAFHRIGGMDERYEGWGGEDYDFLHRLDLDAPLDSYEDWLLHMHHPPSPFIREDGGLVDIPPLSWRPTEPIGRLDRFTAGGQRQAAG